MHILDPTTDITAKGEVQTNEEAQVYVHDLELFVMEKIFEDTLAVLSLGTLCEGHCHAYEWASEQPQPTKNGKTILNNTENFVLIVVLKLERKFVFIVTEKLIGHLSESSKTTKRRHSRSSIGKSKTEITRRATIKQRGIVCEISQIGLRSSQKISKTQKCQHPETLLKILVRNILRNWQYLCSLPETQKLRDLQANQDYKGSVQKTHWHSRTSSRKIR